MMFLANLRDTLGTSIISTWDGIVMFVPTLILAIIVFAIGWIIAALIERVVEGIFKSLRVDALLRSAGLEDVMKRTGYALNSGRFVGSLIKWFIIVVFLVAAFDVLGLNQVNTFLSDVVLTYLPKVIIAVLGLMIAVVIADAMQKIVTASAHATHIKAAHFLGLITKWAIWIFAILSALSTLEIGGLIQTLVTYLFAGLALGVGLAFGLGGKDYAARFIDKTMHTFSDKE